MPYPLLTAGLALTAASVGANIAGQEAAKGAQENVLSRERERQKGYQREAQSIFDKSLSQSGADTAEQQIREGAQHRQEQYQALAAQPPSPAQSLQNRVVSDSGPTAQAAGNAKALQSAWSNIVGGNKARVGGVQDWGLSQNVKNARANQSLAVTGNKAAGSERVSGVEMQDASHAGDGLSTIGQILGAAGMLVGLSAATQPAAAAAITPEQLAAQGGGVVPQAYSLTPNVAGSASNVGTYINPRSYWSSIY